MEEIRSIQETFLKYLDYESQFMRSHILNSRALLFKPVLQSQFIYNSL